MINFITWTVDPAIINEPLEIRYYGLFFAIAFYLGNLIIAKIFKAEDVNSKWLDKLLIYVIIGTVVGARLGHVFFYDWEYYRQNLVEIIMIRNGGLASHGAAIGILIALALYSKNVSKKSMLWILDRVVITIALAAFMIRLGNFFNHEIVGDPSDLPWAVSFKYASEGIEPRHPVQLYEAIAYLSIFAILFYLFWKTNIKQQMGKLFGWFLVMVFSVRLFLEQFKVNQSNISEDALLNMGQVLSIPFILVGFYFILFHKAKATA